MLRLITMAAAMAIGLFPVAMTAQDGLHVEPLFGKTSGLKGNVRSVFLSGENLDGRDLNLFRSLLAHGSAADAQKMADAAEADSQMANDTKRMMKGGELVALYLQLPPAQGNKDNRFVLFRRMGEDSAMLIYMEGPTELDRIVNVRIKDRNQQAQ